MTLPTYTDIELHCETFMITNRNNFRCCFCTQTFMTFLIEVKNYPNIYQLCFFYRIFTEKHINLWSRRNKIWQAGKKKKISLHPFLPPESSRGKLKVFNCCHDVMMSCLKPSGTRLFFLISSFATNAKSKLCRFFLSCKHFAHFQFVANKWVITKLHNTINEHVIKFLPSLFFLNKY